jgi:Flp pilus assembly protein TadD
VAVRPQSAGARCNLGFALVRKGQFDEAAACFREALRLQPDYPDARKMLDFVLDMQRTRS